MLSTSNKTIFKETKRSLYKILLWFSNKQVLKTPKCIFILGALQIFQRKVFKYVQNMVLKKYFYLGKVVL